MGHLGCHGRRFEEGRQHEAGPLLSEKRERGERKASFKTEVSQGTLQFVVGSVLPTLSQIERAAQLQRSCAPVMNEALHAALAGQTSLHVHGSRGGGLNERNIWGGRVRS